MVLSTRIRLARNLAGRPFWGRNAPEDRETVVRRVAVAAESSLGTRGRRTLPARRAAARSRLWLHERQLVSRDLAGLDATGRVQERRRPCCSDGLPA